MKVFLTSAVCAFYIAPLAVDAQSHTPASAPAQPGAGLSYESALKLYQPFRDAPVGSWRRANETVNRIGGWRAYARQAQEPPAAAPSAPAREADPASSKPPTPPQDMHEHRHGAKP